jgi:uncharacterized membrane protein YcgQ (UPF0703/DUF1980 family)
MKPRERLGRLDKISIDPKNCFEVLESMAFGTRGTRLWKEHLLPTYIHPRWSLFSWVRITTAKFRLSIQSNAHINQQARLKDKWMLENRILRCGKILIPALLDRLTRALTSTSLLASGNNSPARNTPTSTGNKLPVRHHQKHISLIENPLFSQIKMNKKLILKFIIHK